MELLPHRQPPGGPRELDSVSACSREPQCGELPGWGYADPSVLVPCCTGGKDGFGRQAELSGENELVLEVEGEARAGWATHSVCSNPCRLWGCKPVTGAASGRQHDPRGVVVAVKPLSGFLEMSQVPFLGSRLEPFGRSISCHAAIMSRCRGKPRGRIKQSWRWS